MGYIESQYPGMFYQSRGKPEGVRLSIWHGGEAITQNFLESINSDFNKSDIYIDYYDISEIGGLGGPGANLIEVINSTDFPLQLYIGQLVLGLFTNFTYDILKAAVMEVIKRAKSNPGNNIIEIHHHTKIVVFNFNNESSTEDDLDLQLRTLLSDTTMEERLKEDPELVRKILDKYSRG